MSVFKNIAILAGSYIGPNNGLYTATIAVNQTDRRLRTKSLVLSLAKGGSAVGVAIADSDAVYLSGGMASLYQLDTQGVAGPPGLGLVLAYNPEGHFLTSPGENLVVMADSPEPLVGHITYDFPIIE